MITFIVVTWNNEELIKDFFESIYKYCKFNFKIIIIDNNSSDNTVKEIKKYSRDNCRIIENSENVGFAKGNNIALNYVDTEFTCYINPDIIFIDNAFEEMVEILNKDSNVGIVGPKLLNRDLSIQRSAFNFEHGWKLIASQFNIRQKIMKTSNIKAKSKKVDWIMGAVMLLRTKDAVDLGGFSEEYYMYIEDMDLCMKMKKMKNKDVFYYSDYSIIHLGGQSEKKNNNYKKDEMVIDNIILFNEKFYHNKKHTISIMKFCYLIKYMAMRITKIINKNCNLKYEKMKNSYYYLKNKTF